ncbi:MAG TPA: DUF1559 domain-containing protein, partial [Planctomicrobium sp.]|nr:DUF1559 domain-containing protein [Planctomicrobium sp.]
NSSLNFNGLFAANSRINLRDITDGASNTFAVGEVENNGRNGGVWVGSFGSPRWAGVFFNAWTGALINANSGTTPAWARDYVFSSLHTGGTHFLKADGSVHFVSENISGITYERLANRRDGNVVGEH